MAGQQDEDVDSGWGDDEDEPQSTRAVDSRLLLAQAGFAQAPAAASEPAPVPAPAPTAPPPPAAPMTARSPAPADETSDDDDDEPQSTRAVDSRQLLAAAGLMRSAPEQEKENRQAFERETMPPPGPPPVAPSSRPPSGRPTAIPESPRSSARSGPPAERAVPSVGRRNTPVVSDAPLRARTLDATAKAKAKPPSIVTPLKVQAVVPPAGGGSSIRFGGDADANGKRDRSRSLTPKAHAAFAAPVTALKRPQPTKPEPAPPAARATRDPLPTLVETEDMGSIEVEELGLSEEEEAALSQELDSVELDSEPSGGSAASDPLYEVRKHFDRGDFLGASLRAELLLQDRPGFVEARKYLEQSKKQLRQMYLEKLGSGSMVLRLAMRPDEIHGLSLDHRAGFLFSLIDGAATIDEVLDMCSMPQLEALRLLYDMQQQGVVVPDPKQRR